MATEKRLIDANDLKALFDERYDDAFMQSYTRPNIAYWEGYSCGVNWGRNTIADAPTVDAVEVVYGEWTVIEDDYAMETIYQCSVCKEDFVTIDGDQAEKLWNYYPNCGAKMDGGVQNGL